jgi:hypothetical protein
VLLFKAAGTGEKDEYDFDREVGSLTAERRARLAGWLRHAHPQHPWIDRLHLTTMPRAISRRS